MSMLQQRTEQLSRTRREREALDKTLQTTSDPEERASIERKIKSLSDTENQLSGIVRSLRNKEAQRIQRRQDIQDVREARQQAIRAGEGSQEEVAFLKKRASLQESLEASGQRGLSRFTPLKFKGASQVQGVRVVTTYETTPIEQSEFSPEIKGIARQYAQERKGEFQASFQKKQYQSLSGLSPAKLSRSFTTDNPDVLFMARTPSYLIPPDRSGVDFIGRTSSTEFIVQNLPKGDPNSLSYKYGSAEKKTSQFLKPAFKFAEKRTRPVRVARGAAQEYLISKTGKFQPELMAGARATDAFFGEYYSEIKQRPLRFAASTTAFTLLPGAFSVVGKTGSWLGRTTKATSLFTKASKLPGAGYATKMLGGTIKYGILIAYGASVGYRTMKPKGLSEKSRELGRISAGEFTPMILGGYAGSKIFPRLFGRLSTIKREEIATELIVPEDVLLNVNKFPLAPQRTHLSLFRKQEYALPNRVQRYSGSRYQEGVWENINQARYPFRTLRPKPMAYHATAEYLDPLISKGSSELPGLYTSYGVSPHFLRLDSEIQYYGNSLFNPYGSPKVASIIPKGFSIGRTVGGRVWDKSANVLGKAYVPGIKTEVEAILLPGTRLNRLAEDTKYFFRWKGVRVPIDQYEVQKSGTFVINKFGAISKSGRSISYRLPTSTPITTPSTYLFGLSSSYYPVSSINDYYPYSKSYPRSSGFSSFVSSSNISRKSSYSYGLSSLKTLFSGYSSKPYSYKPISVPSYSGSEISNVPSYLPPSVPSSRPPSYVPRYVPPPAFPPPASLFGKFKLKQSVRKGKRSTKNILFNPKYVGSVEAGLKNLRGKKSLVAASTGLDIRKIAKVM